MTAERQGTPLLELLGTVELDALRQAGHVRHHEPGAVLFVEGDGCAQVYVLLAGLLKLSKSTVDGREVLLEIRGSGDVIGELSAIDGQPRSATGTVITNVELLVIAVDRFQSLMAEHQVLSNAIMASIAGRLREASYRRLEMGTSDALARVCLRLVELAEMLGNRLDAASILVHSPISQQELAEWAGVSRDAVVRSLKTMRDLGWLVTGRGQFMILDIDALRRRAAAVR